MPLWQSLSASCRRSVPLLGSYQTRLPWLFPSCPQFWSLGRAVLLPPHHNHQLQHQVRAMSKYLSKSAKKRLTLTTKRAHKGFYKGKGGTKEGRLTSKGRFIVNRLKRLELVVPDLSGFRLKPYIASSASKFPPEERHGLYPKV
jgi:Mitochondrial ribosomal protein L27